MAIFGLIKSSIIKLIFLRDYHVTSNYTVDILVEKHVIFSVENNIISHQIPSNIPTLFYLQSQKRSTGRTKALIKSRVRNI